MQLGLALSQENKLKYERKLLDLERFIKDVEADRDRLQANLAAVKSERSVRGRLHSTCFGVTTCLFKKHLQREVCYRSTY